MHLLQPYLPANPAGEDREGGATVSPKGGYAEGGSLYALGLIHGSHSGSSAEKRNMSIFAINIKIITVSPKQTIEWISFI